MAPSEWLELAALVAIGASSWTLVSGVFAAAVWEVHRADPPPEGYKLFSVLDLWVQLPNLLPAFLVLFSPPGWVPAHAERLTGALLFLGLVDAVWLALGSNIATKTDSIGLILGAVGGGLLGSTSMSVFFPWAATLGRSAASSLTAISLGVGMCGLLAQLLAYGSDSGIAYGSGMYFSVVAGFQVSDPT